jgi:hypothetical protein
VAEHRGRVVQIGGREDQRDALRRDLRQPRRELRAGLLRQACRIEGERGLQPAVARDERALGVLPRLVDALTLEGSDRRGEEGGERRFELGLRVGLAALGVEERRAVDQAGVARPEQVRAVVAEIEPGAPLREAPCPGALDQLVQVAGGAARGRPGKADQERDEEAEAVAAQQAQAMT